MSRAVLGDRVARARVLGFDQDQARLHPADVEGADARGVDPVALTHVEEPVPDRKRSLGRHPELVAPVARVSGARDVDGDAGDLAHAAAEVLHVDPVGAGHLLQDLPRESTLERERGGGVADVGDLHVEAGGVHQEPAVAGVRGRDAVSVLREARHGAVVEDLALLVAPGRVVGPVDRELGHVPRHHAVEEPEGVGARDLVLVERAHVDHGRRLSDGVVFDVVEVGVDGGGEVAGPLTPGEPGVQLLLALEERGADAHPGPPRICARPRGPRRHPTGA